MSTGEDKERKESEISDEAESLGGWGCGPFAGVQTGSLGILCRTISSLCLSKLGPFLLIAFQLETDIVADPQKSSII